MLILSIYTGHNAAVCIMRDDQILINIELERYSRIKHDFGYNPEFIQWAMNCVGVSINEVDLVALNNWGGKSNRDGSMGRPYEHIPTTMHHVAFTANILGRDTPAIAVNHHLAHVASAYYTSSFNESSVFTWDGGGDNENASYSYCKDGKIISYQPLNLEELAGWWSSLTFNNYRMRRIHEWDPGSGAGKLMALAAYGQSDPDIIKRLMMEMGALPWDETRGEPPCKVWKTDSASWAFNWNEDLSDTKSRRSQNLAWAIQSYTENRVKEHFHNLWNKHPSDNICYQAGLH